MAEPACLHMQKTLWGPQSDISVGPTVRVTYEGTDDQSVQMHLHAPKSGVGRVVMHLMEMMQRNASGRATSVPIFTNSHEPKILLA